MRHDQLLIAIVVSVFFVVVVTFYSSTDTGDTADLWGFESGTKPEDAARQVHSQGRYLVLEVEIEQPDGSTKVFRRLRLDCSWPNGVVPLETQASRPIGEHESELYFFATEYARRFTSEMEALVLNSSELPCR